MSAEEFGRAAVLVILLLATVFVGVVLVDGYRRRRRALVYRAALMAWNGWSPAPPDPRLVAFGTLLGLQGQPTQMFTGDFRGRRLFILYYEFGSTEESPEACLIALRLPGALPPLTVSEDVPMERVLGEDIELESQAFNDKFRVQGYTRRFASAVLQPRLMEWMLLNPLRWHVAGNMLVTWGHHELTGAEITARLETLAGVIDRIPPFVFRDNWATS
ncbi:hypothetical protein GCM10029976_078560 [Kribbella albertanoniae]|uniref:DUF3137 domain-containing protein n=1 Tax=Kribbella albertanoniae TaxID=1266829 RepID=A0A4V6PA36_9ACTN|nr:hypothetical protein [Kribbella albertanoniae]TDC15606.1 hypothetical protein E1261_40270 [Kribbella albertanoniae]